MARGKELEISRWMTCPDVSLLQFLGDKYKEDEVAIDDASSMQSVAPAVEDTSEGESAEIVTLFRTNFVRKVFRETWATTWR